MKVRLDGGDGYCAFFRDSLLLSRVDETWFSGKVGKWGDAILFKVIGGQHNGRYIAFTSRVTISIEQQFRRGDWASVVVHDIKNPTMSFAGRDSDSDPCGMAAIQLISDNR